MSAVGRESPRWRRSSACQSGNCAEVARSGEDILLRNSRDPSGHRVRLNAEEWAAFLTGAKAGEFDDLLDPAEP